MRNAMVMWWWDVAGERRGEEPVLWKLLRSSSPRRVNSGDQTSVTRSLQFFDLLQLWKACNSRYWP